MCVPWLALGPSLRLRGESQGGAMGVGAVKAGAGRGVPPAILLPLGALPHGLRRLTAHRDLDLRTWTDASPQ
jgi:hypothetical protein